MSKVWIQNFKELATTPNREHALRIMEAGLSAIDTETILRGAVRLTGETLTIQNEAIALKGVERIFVFAFGKAAARAAETLESILGERIRGGVVIGTSLARSERIETFVGTHPRPTETNVAASRRLMEVAKGMTEKDLALVVVSGGGSALVCSPESEREQGTALYNAFLKSNGTIHELNIVRKHLSSLKGGGLAKLLYPARVCGLVFSDVPGVHPEIIASGLTYFDQTTVEDAQRIIDKYKLGSYQLMETTKEKKYFERITNLVLVSNLNAIEAMEQKALSLGYTVLVLSTKVYDEVNLISEELGLVSRPNQVVLAGGEPRLVVSGSHGTGGRNQYLSLAMALKLKPNQVFISFASDGRDNNDAAGGVVDAGTLERAKRAGIDIAKHVAEFDAMTALIKTGDLIYTGPTGTNVSDLMIMLESK
ncbi:MAG: DUF4147 domain-containing protein [bacterium]|nr:DUF4147 domain-containing protein [bacterium]